MGFFTRGKEERSLATEGPAVIGTNLQNFAFLNGLGAIKNSDIRKAVQTIANDVSSSPIRTKIHGQVQEQGSLDHLLNVRPNAIQDARTFWFVITVSMLLNGNAYAEIIRDKQGNVVELQFLPINQLTPNLNYVGNRIDSYSYTGEGKSIEFDAKDILHFKHFTTDGVMGISPLKSLTTEINLLEQSNKALLSFYNRSVKGSGKVIIKKQQGAGLNKEGANKFRKDFAELNSPSNTESLGLIVVEEDKFDFENIAIDTGFLNIINNTMFEQKQIAKVFDIPIERFGMETVNSSSLELNTQYVQGGLRHYLKAFEAELTFKLGAGLEEFKFDTSDLTKQAFKELIESLTLGVKSTILTPNEARAELGYSPIEGGDKLIANTAFADKGEI